jgi:hypothetical protein
MRTLLLTGLLHPLNLMMLGLALVAGLVVAWWMFPIGLVFWLVMVLTVSRDPSLRISHKMQSRAPVAQRFQPYVDRVERAQLSIFNSLASAPANTRRALQPVQAALDTLAAQLTALCQRMSTVENYRVVSSSTSDPRVELQQIGDAIKQATDPRVKEQYQESHATLAERIAMAKLVSTELDRVEAVLVGLTNEIDSIVAEVIRLQAAGAAEAARQAPELVRQLEECAADLGASEWQVPWR